MTVRWIGRHDRVIGCHQWVGFVSTLAKIEQIAVNKGARYAVRKENVLEHDG